MPKQKREPTPEEQERKEGVRALRSIASSLRKAPINNQIKEMQDSMLSLTIKALRKSPYFTDDELSLMISEVKNARAKRLLQQEFEKQTGSEA